MGKVVKGYVAGSSKSDGREEGALETRLLDNRSYAATHPSSMKVDFCPCWRGRATP